MTQAAHKIKLAVSGPRIGTFDREMAGADNSGPAAISQVMVCLISRAATLRELPWVDSCYVAASLQFSLLSAAIDK